MKTIGCVVFLVDTGFIFQGSWADLGTFGLESGETEYSSCSDDATDTTRIKPGRASWVCELMHVEEGG